MKRVNALKSALSRLGQSLVFESPLEMMKNAFSFTLKALFTLELFELSK